LKSKNHKSEPPGLDDFVKLNLAQISRVEDSLQELKQKNMSKKALYKMYISDLLNAPLIKT